MCTIPCLWFKMFVFFSTGWPNALAIDTYTEKVFVGDAKLDYIMMTDLDGNNRKIILQQGLDHIFSLTVDDDSLYWSDWGKNKIHSVHKFTGKNMQTLATLIHRPMGEYSIVSCLFVIGFVCGRQVH